MSLVLAQERGFLACEACGFKHFSRGGRLKWYVGALQCPVYVGLVVQELLVVGRGRGWLSTDQRPVGSRLTCGAPGGFLCFYKGSGGVCTSPDGFPSEVEGVQKYRICRDSSRALEPDESLLCVYQGKLRLVKGSVPAPRHLASPRRGGESRVLVGPGFGDVRRARVERELRGRIRFLREEGLGVSAEAVAKLGGFAERVAHRGTSG